MLTVFLISCGDSRVMTLVELPQGWTDKTGQEFIEKMDIRKLEYIVFKKFPEASQKQITFSIMPLVFSPSGEKEKQYKYEIRVFSKEDWDKTKTVEKFIAEYITNLLSRHETLNPMVFVKVPQGYSIQSSQQLLKDLDMGKLGQKLSEKIPGIEQVPILIKIVPVENKPNELKFHVIVVANFDHDFDHDFEYKVEQEIASFLKENIKTT